VGCLLSSAGKPPGLASFMDSLSHPKSRPVCPQFFFYKSLPSKLTVFVLAYNPLRPSGHPWFDWRGSSSSALKIDAIEVYVFAPKSICSSLFLLVGFLACSLHRRLSLFVACFIQKPCLLPSFTFLNGCTR
jgi:hypothetical protein